MDKLIYIVRHCSAEGQAPLADLTTEGILQASELGQFFDGLEADRIISSPFKRAQGSAWPIADRKKLHVEVDSRLAERVLSSRDLEDWLVKLEDTFFDVDLKFEGGESSGEAMSRVCDVVDELGHGSRTVLVTHGNLMALLLKHYDERFSFEGWQALSNPDVYQVRITDDGADVKRIWN